MRAMITAMTTTASTPKARTISEPKPKYPRQTERKTQLPDADCDDVSSFPHENSRNKNYDNHNFFLLGECHSSTGRWTPNAGQRIHRKVSQHGPWTQDWRLVFLPSGHCSIFMKSLHINQCSPICRRAEKGIKDLWPWPAQAESSFKYCLT